MPRFVVIVSESLQNIFAVPADICDATLGGSARELRNNATHRFSNQIVTDAFTGLAETRGVTPALVAQHTPEVPPGRVAEWVARVDNRTVGEDEGSSENTKVHEGQLPRETELARKQITSSDVANGILGILEEPTKDKNR
jgi:hypothetical protein